MHAMTHGDDTELVIALVCPLGTNVQMVLNELETELNEHGFSSSVHRLSDYLIELSGSDDFNQLPFDERLASAMSAGDTLRDRWQAGDALALCAISDIAATRESRAEYEIQATTATEDGPTLPASLRRHAYILRSLKTQGEVETLRAVYGSRFVLMAAYSPDEKRLQHLTAEIRSSRLTNDPTTWAHQPEELIERDWAEQVDGGQDVVGTFQQADFFIDATDENSTRRHVVRTLEILFGHPFRTPTRDEFAQFAAQGAALRSAELGRQVGAAICSKGGAVLALGMNEVSKFGGGSHWEEDPDKEDHREFRFSERDTNRKYQDRIADDVVSRIKQRLKQDVAAASGEEAAKQADPVIDQLADIFRKSMGKGSLRELTEYGRAVHAEMDALLDAARRGVAVEGATLYVTTFPCHTCARHIVAAGIDRVVYISPYPKSRAEELHGDALTIASSNAGGRVSFEPFVGVAPRRYLHAFDAAARERLGHLPRKDSDAFVQSFEKSSAQPVIPDVEPDHLRPVLAAYRQRELPALDHYEQKRSSTETSDVAGTTASEGETGA
jgi:deoxycytidylate deaminase